ncbi:MAG: AraC family transcriptional regulator [Paenibacillus sp.]|nr:AraC family transcriptional regulator [Paenibacillus sp.]
MSEWVPELITHAYWEQKEQFLYDKDTYLTWVLFAVEEGRFEYKIGNECGEAEFGDLVICPPHIAFYRSTLSPLSFHAITFTIINDENQSTLNLLPERKIRLTQTQRLSEDYHLLRLDDQALNFNMNTQRMKQHYFLDLWLMLIQQNRQQLNVIPFSNDDELIRDVALYLNNHAHESIEIQNVANHFELTPVNLLRRFKKVYQINPLQYLTSIRVKKACSLLLQTEWKLDVIAEKCGYENGFYLSRVFSKIMGISPSAFRKQNRF